MLLGFDVSHHQPSIDFDRAKREGLGFVICKASQGTGMTDQTFAGRRRAAQHAGLIVGAYHFLERGNAAAQAQHFASVLAAAGGHAGIGVCVDVELQNPTVGPSTDDVTQFVHHFTAATGRRLVLYTGGWYWRGHLRNPNVCADLPLWHSAYIDGHGSAEWLFAHGGKDGKGVTPGFWTSYGGWRSYSIRQYSASATVAGVGGVDVDYYGGSAAQLAQMLGVTPARRRQQSPPPLWLHRALREGSHGGDVALLQQWLNYRGARLTVDGNFGPKTTAAVRTFQRRAHIGVDGVVWRQTVNALTRG